MNKKSIHIKHIFLLLSLTCSISTIGQQVIIDDIYVLLPKELLVENRVKKIIHHNRYSTNKLSKIYLRPDGQKENIQIEHYTRKDTNKVLITFEYDQKGNLKSKIGVHEKTKDTLLYEVNTYENEILTEKEIRFPNIVRKELFTYDDANKLIQKTIKSTNYEAIQEYDEMERTIRYSRKYDENDIRLETSLEYKIDTVLVCQFYNGKSDTTIVELNKNSYPVFSGKTGSRHSQKEQYLYNENGLIKNIIHRRKPRHTFEYEYWED